MIRPKGVPPSTRTSLGAPPTPRFGLAKQSCKPRAQKTRRGNEVVCVCVCVCVTRDGRFRICRKTGKYRDRTSQRVPRQATNASDAIACPGCDAARATAKRCIADPGPPQTGTVPGLQRTTSCCAAPGIRDRGAFWRNEPNRHFGQTNPSGEHARGAKDQPAAARNSRRRNFIVSGCYLQ
jgi:hypothetical protein